MLIDLLGFAYFDLLGGRGEPIISILYLQWVSWDSVSINVGPMLEQIYILFAEGASLPI